MKGQDKIKNDTAIVAGDMSKPQQGAAPRPEVVKNDAQQQQNEQKVRAEQVPLSGVEKKEGLSEDGIASNISKLDTPSNQAEQAVEGARDGKDAEGGLIASTQNTKAQPKARPRLTQAMPSILTTRKSGSPDQASCHLSVTSQAGEVAPIGCLSVATRSSEYVSVLLKPSTPE